MDPEFTTDYSIRYHVRNDEVQKIIIGMRIQLAFQSVCSHILIYASLTSSRYNPLEAVRIRLGCSKLPLELHVDVHATRVPNAAD
ncbi:unnamed protein product [Urochloa humidicola]